MPRGDWGEKYTEIQRLIRQGYSKRKAREMVRDPNYVSKRKEVRARADNKGIRKPPAAPGKRKP